MLVFKTSEHCGVPQCRRHFRGTSIKEGADTRSERRGERFVCCEGEPSSLEEMSEKCFSSELGRIGD